jgi:hypothetical protein
MIARFRLPSDDEILANADEMDLKLMAIEGVLTLIYEIRGSIGWSLNGKEENGAVIEPRKHDAASMAHLLVEAMRTKGGHYDSASCE